jgi:hypothetical protein
MDWSESNTHSFIVKVWLEETIEEAGQAKWRGHITHVQSEQRQYLKNLDEIGTFIAPFLESMSVNLGIWRQVKQWLHRWKQM